MAITPFILRMQAQRHEKLTLVQIMHAEYEWRKTRSEFLKNQPLCQMCGITRELQVHHVYPWHLFIPLRFVHDNLVTLCQPCHFRFGHWQDWHRFNPEILELCKQAQINNPVIDWALFNKFQRNPDRLNTIMPVGMR